jgi:hypothetical protein
LTLPTVERPLNGKLQQFFPSGSIFAVATLDKLRSFVEDLPSPVRMGLTAIACILPVGLIVHAVTFWGRGIIDPEAMEFVLNYLQRRPFFAQIFDPQINDWGAYQARELSYVFDLIDARWFAFLLDRHIFVLVPLSGVLGLIAVSAIYFWGARKVFGLNLVTTSLLLALFLSCIVVQASTPIFYRSSKIILCIALVAFLFYLFALLKLGKARVTLSKMVTLVSLDLVMALSDRQGFYYLISATAVVLVLWLFAKRREASVESAHVRVIGANAAAIIATVFYNRFLTPRLVHGLNGYWPDFSYQNLPWSNLFDPSLPGKALHIFQDQIEFFFGNIPFPVLALVIVAGGVAFFWNRKGTINFANLSVLWVSLMVTLALIGLLATMTARHPAFYEIRDHEFWYYTLTLHVIFLFGITAWLGLIDPDRIARFKLVLYPLLIILIALNLSNYPRQRDTMIHSTGWFDNQYAHSQALVEQFRNDPPRREKLLARSSDSFLDDPEHFLENVELSYLHLIGAVHTEPPPQQ